MKRTIIPGESFWCRKTSLEVAKSFAVACRYKRTNRLLIIAEACRDHTHLNERELYSMEDLTPKMLAENIYTLACDLLNRKNKDNPAEAGRKTLRFYYGEYEKFPLIELDLLKWSMEINPEAIGFPSYFTGSFEEAIQFLDTQLNTPISDLSLLDPGQWEKVLVSPQDEALYFEDNLPLITYIRNSIRQFPENTAYIFNGESITYAQLDMYSDILATILLDKKIAKGEIVLIGLENSLELPVAYIACMKTGAVFTPIDIRWPGIRMAELIRSIKPKAIIAAAGSPLFNNEDAVPVITADWEVWKIKSGRDLPVVDISNEDLLYGFFTSGSTGLPKCTLNKQKGVVNRFSYMSKVFDIRFEEDIILQNSNTVFDSSLWQLLWPLLEGCRVIIPERKSYLDLDYTIDLIDTYKITMTDFVPSIFNLLVQKMESSPELIEKLRSVKTIIVGGEESQIHFIQRFYKLCPWVQLVNTYGHTEASIGMVFYTIPPDIMESEVPLGRPIDNTYVIILDENQKPVPRGFVGEFYVGGVCPGEGYYNDPEKTTRVLLENPFGFIPGKRIFRTGDFGNVGRNGLLFYRGRKDEQIKIEGIRLDLKEIESHCLNYPPVKAVKILFDSKSQRLVAFVVSENELSESDVLLKQYLQGRLPKHAVPSLIIFLPELPLTENGKVNVTRLKDLIVWERGDEALSVSDEIRSKFKAAVGRQKVGDEDNFFESGGSSLSGLKLILEIENAFKVKIDIAEIYSDFSIRNLLALTDKVKKKNTAAGPDGAMEAIIADYMKLGVLSDNPVQPIASAPRSAVLLTGASGYFGTQLLSDLLEQSDCTIYCIMRIRDQEEAYTRLRERLTYYSLPQKEFGRERVKVVSGDLAQKYWGLEPEVIGHLQQEVGIVIHNGAEVNLAKNYLSLRDVNVRSLQFLLEFCMNGKIKQLHFISSVSVFSEKLLNYYDIIPDKILYDLNCLPSAGYSQSKWAAEKILAAARDKGLPVSIYRFGEITPHSETGIANEKSLLYMLIQTMAYLKCYPGSNLQLDCFPADLAGTFVVKSATTPRTVIYRDFNVINLDGPTINQMGQLFNEYGIEMEQVSYASFADRVEEAAATGVDVPGFLLSLKFMLPKIADHSMPEDPMTKVFLQFLGRVSDNHLSDAMEFIGIDGRRRLRTFNLFLFVEKIIKGDRALHLNYCSHPTIK